MRQSLSLQQRDLVVRWWSAMQPSAQGEPGHFMMMGRQDRARLKRCTSPADVLLQSSLHRLAQAMNREPDDRVDLSALAMVVGVLANVKSHVPGRLFAPALGSKSESGRPYMSEVRFQQLQTCRDEQSFFVSARHAVDLLKGAVDVGHLANDLMQWIVEFRNPDLGVPPELRLKLRWAAEYYGAALPVAQDKHSN